MSKNYIFLAVCIFIIIFEVVIYIPYKIDQGQTWWALSGAWNGSIATCGAIFNVIKIYKKVVGNV
jgi:hypothetical protein